MTTVVMDHAVGNTETWLGGGATRTDLEKMNAMLGSPQTAAG